MCAIENVLVGVTVFVTVCVIVEAVLAREKLIATKKMVMNSLENIMKDCNWGTLKTRRKQKE